MNGVYFAYGSNLLFARLQARCPSVEHIGVARLPHHRLHFNKPGGDGSGKCGIEAVPDDDWVLGVLYRLSYEDKMILDRIEGIGHGYVNREVVVQTDQGPMDCFTYYPTRHEVNRPPWDWYKAYVIQGARENRFPAAYLTRLETVASQVDLDSERRRQNLAILSRASCPFVGG